MCGCFSAISILVAIESKCRMKTMKVQVCWGATKEEWLVSVPFIIPVHKGDK
jgi:hypothetical protein